MLGSVTTRLYVHKAVAFNLAIVCGVARIDCVASREVVRNFISSKVVRVGGLRSWNPAIPERWVFEG